jgi:hypothetical protein
MRRISVGGFTFACIATFLSASSIAQEFAFHHQGGLSVDETKVGFFTAWNPKGPGDLLAPGVKIDFFGAASTCDEQMDNGPVSNSSHYSDRAIAEDTGLRVYPGIENDAWTPSSDPKHCSLEGKSQRSGSFVVRGTPDEHGAIGLYTTVGPDENGRMPLVGNFDSKGQIGNGSNAGVSGTFVTFRFDWGKPAAPSLWPTTASKDAQAAAAIELLTTQTLATASLGNSSNNPGAPVKQVKQQLTVTLINPACFRALAKSGKRCQVQYLFNLAVVRSGVTDWSKVDWFNTASVQIDPAQGNMPYINGPVGVKGQVTRDATLKYDLYTSAGDESAHGTFMDRTFRVRLSLGQFENTLRLATAKVVGKTSDAVSPDDIAQLFGSAWNDPAAWKLLSAEVGQEIYNASPDSESHIGGNFREIGIRPVSSTDNE